MGFWEEEARGEDAAAVGWAGGEGRGRGEGAMFVDDGVLPGCCYRSLLVKGEGGGEPLLGCMHD